MAVGNCASYGGGMRICPDADPADGLLDVVVGAAAGAGHAGAAAARGCTAARTCSTRWCRRYRAKVVEIEAHGIVGYADGERIAPLPLTVTCIPGALRLLTG